MGTEGRGREGRASDFKTETVPLNVYLAVIGHQKNEEWAKRDLQRWLYTWADRFIKKFRLEIPMPPIGIWPIHAHRLGHFRPNRNCWGLEGEIILNEKHLTTQEDWKQLGTLLHELLHAWQHKHGKAGRNN